MDDIRIKAERASARLTSQYSTCSYAYRYTLDRFQTGYGRHSTVNTLEDVLYETQSAICHPGNTKERVSETEPTIKSARAPKGLAVIQPIAEATTSGV